MPRPTFARLVLGASLLAAACTAHAALTQFNSLAAFNAAIANAATDTFNDLLLPCPTGNTLSLIRAPGSYGYKAQLVGQGTSFCGPGGSDQWLSTDLAGDSISFTTFTGGVHAIGGFFFNSDFNFNAQSGRSVTVTAVDGDDTEAAVLANTNSSSFLGFISDGLITSLTVTANNTSTVGSLTWPTVNNLILGQRPAIDDNPNPAPEPTTMALVGLAALALASTRRRRQAVTA